jgi:hypothetical protein
LVARVKFYFKKKTTIISPSIFHLLIEDFGLRLCRLRDETLIQQLQDGVADLLQFILYLDAVILGIARLCLVALGLLLAENDVGGRFFGIGRKKAGSWTYGNIHAEAKVLKKCSRMEKFGDWCCKCVGVVLYTL